MILRTAVRSHSSTGRKPSIESPPQHRSVSQANSCLTCGLAYYFGRILNLPRSPAAWFIQGTAVHSAVEAWECSWREAPSNRVLEVFDFVWNEEETRAWEREPDPDGWQRSGMKKVENDLRDRKLRGRQQVLDYMENTAKERLRPWVLPDEHRPATEVPFEEDFGGVTVKGYIDLILEDPETHQLVVRDLKTGAKKPVGWFQLATYRFAIKKKYGVDPQWGDYWMAKDAGPSSPIYLGGVSEALITSQYQIVDDTIQRENFGANIGDHCNRCDVARHCPFVGGEPPEGIPMLGT